MKRVILNPFSMFLIGLILGIISRLLDIYTENLGNIFSQMAIWILFGVLISIYSSSKKKAMLRRCTRKDTTPVLFAKGELYCCAVIFGYRRVLLPSAVYKRIKYHF
ncbi:MAG: hypothetical protein U0L88_12420 [Acutalibacteraceae bacterium]|nr:hypothetical protein [Acutalibacteraceae bacterium]